MIDNHSTNQENGPASGQLRGETLVGRISRLMVAQGLSKTALAIRSGVDRSDLSRLLNGKRPPRPKELAFLAPALGCTLEELVAGLELPERLRRALDVLEEAARQVLAAQSATAEAEARLRAAEQEHAKEVDRLKRERDAHQAALGVLKEESDRRLASFKDDANRAEQRLLAERTQHADERAALENALQQLNALHSLQKQQIAILQQRLARAESEKFGTSLLAGFAGALTATMLGRRDDDDDDDDDDD